MATQGDNDGNDIRNRIVGGDKTKDGRTIRWADALSLATSLADTLEGVGFVPPERRSRVLEAIARGMSEIATALCLSKSEINREVLRGLSASTPAAKEWLDAMIKEYG